MVLKRTGSVARGGVALGQDRDLDGLDGAAVARRTGVGAVARPAEPSELGGVDAVPDGVVGRQVRGQPDPQGLDGYRVGSEGLAVFRQVNLSKLITYF